MAAPSRPGCQWPLVGLDRLLVTLAQARLELLRRDVPDPGGTVRGTPVELQRPAVDAADDLPQAIQRHRTVDAQRGHSRRQPWWRSDRRPARHRAPASVRRAALALRARGSARPNGKAGPIGAARSSAPGGDAALQTGEVRLELRAPCLGIGAGHRSGPRGTGPPHPCPGNPGRAPGPCARPDPGRRRGSGGRSALGLERSGGYCCDAASPGASSG